MIGSNQARELECTLRTAFDHHGKLLASHFSGAINNGAYPHYLDANTAAAMSVWTAYNMPKFGFRREGLFTNTVGLSAYPGPQGPTSIIAA